MGIFNPKRKETGAADPILTRIVAEDKVPWYRKPNLRTLYFLLFPTCMGIELTSGFDSQMINALQIVPSWVEHFHNPQGSLKGIIAASYSLGAILSLPLVPIVNDRLGRRWAIFLGSVVMCIGAIIQGCAVNAGMVSVPHSLILDSSPTSDILRASRPGLFRVSDESRTDLSTLLVYRRAYGARIWHSHLHHRRVCADWRACLSERASHYDLTIQRFLLHRANHRCRNLLRHQQHRQQLGMESTIATADGTIIPTNILRLVSDSTETQSRRLLTTSSFLPESPRWLLTKDRSEEAYSILVKYHAEGDAQSEFVKAEMAQIRSTLTLELEASKKSWADMFATPGMRRRTFIGSMLGLFTQWSGNTLIS